MENEKLKKIIADANQKLEWDAVRRAEQIIGRIVTQQETIKGCTQEIARLRKELADLNVETLDPTEVLGS